MSNWGLEARMQGKEWVIKAEAIWKAFCFITNKIQM